MEAREASDEYIGGVFDYRDRPTQAIAGKLREWAAVLVRAASALE